MALEAQDACCELRVPADAAPGATIHVVCRVCDDGRGGTCEPLAAYARVIVTVA